MRVLFLILLFYCGCTSSENKNKAIAEKDKVTVVDPSTDNHFDVFLRNFKKVDLPFNLTIDSPYWIDFSDRKSRTSVIPRDKIKKYFYANNEEQWKASKFNQFYYGQTFLINDNLIGVSFYGTSKEDNSINGYQLILFSKNGELKNSLLIAGSRGIFDTDMQMEAEITKREITINKIELNLDEIKDLSRFNGKQKFIVYQMSEDGSLKKANETAYKIKTLTIDEDHYRIKILE